MVRHHQHHHRHSDGVSPIFGYATLFIVAGLVSLGLLSLAFILRFRLKTRRGHFFALRDFNSLWPIRILLVASSFSWALSELFRLPLLRLPGWTFSRLGSAQQVDLCRIHVTASLGLAEPCFFMAAMSLLRGSLHSRPNERSAVAVTLLSCLPALALHSFVAFVLPRLNHGIPEFFVDAAVVERGRRAAVWCAFPLLSTIATVVAGTAYVPYFLTLSWRMMDLVINRRLLHGLALTVLIASSSHVACMCISVFWKGQEVAFQAVALLSFASVSSCIIAAEVILVILPISDSLAVDMLIDTDDRVDSKFTDTRTVPMVPASWEDDRQCEEGVLVTNTT